VQLSAALDQFDDWLEVHRLDSDPWPGFDEFIRTMLYRCCHATHARPYRLLSDGRELAPLRGPDYTGETRRIRATGGIIGQVIATGRAYVAGDPGHEDVPHEPADEGGEPIAWCFAVSDGTRRLGVVTVGHLDVAPWRIGPLLGTAARLAEQFWRTLRETCLSRSAAITDPVSGLRTREPFLRAAEQSLAESYTQEEPVAVAVVALEGLRLLDDSGRWEVADDIVREVGAILSQKIRMDDRLGRFDGSRFILLLRRVDSELASLITGQIMSRLVTVCGDQSRWGASIKLRCGMAGSGAERPDLRTLVARALQQGHRARQENARIASDLEVIAVGSGS
ncbi:MAG: diguanylate cyclase, partial [Planctomycetes bacterium]|nr:diguanylate cyclase [Planctomycetota bacterium]